MVENPGTSWSFQDVIKVKEDDKIQFHASRFYPLSADKKRPLKLREYQNFLCLFMKSVKRVFTKSLPRYNLRSRKSAVPVARNSTPKVNREVQASLSEEENCTLSFELPFHPSSLPPTAHVTSSSEEIEPIQSNGLPRFSTAFSEQNPANRTNTEAIDISIDPCEGPSIVQQSLPEPTTSFVPRQESDASPSEDFIPQQSSQSHHGPRTDLEVEETSDSEVEESLQRRFFQIINSPEHFDALVRRSINYTKPKQTKARKRLRHESKLSSDSEDEQSETESEAIEEFCAKNAVANEGAKNLIVNSSGATL